MFLSSEKGGGSKDKEAIKNEKEKAKDERSNSRGKEKAKGGAEELGKPNGGPTSSSSAPHSPEIGPVPAPTPDALPNQYTADDRRKDTILLIQQLCLMGKNVQLPVRLQLFRTLVDRGILHAIQWALCRPEPLMISTAGEVLALLLDHDVIGVRQHVMRQVGVAGKPTMGVSVSVAGHAGDGARVEGNRETLLDTLCRSLTSSSELAYKSQMADALRAVLEVPQTDGMETNVCCRSIFWFCVASDSRFFFFFFLHLYLQPPTMRAMARAKDDPVTERFMEYFYAKCCENLFRPMVELPEYQKITGAIAFFFRVLYPRH